MSLVEQKQQGYMYEGHKGRTVVLGESGKLFLSRTSCRPHLKPALIYAKGRDL